MRDITPEKKLHWENVVRSLTEPRDLISTPDRWIKNRQKMIRDDGVPCYCVMGAVMATQHNHPGTYNDAMFILRTTCRTHSMGVWNDLPYPNHKMVMTAFRKAIASANKFATESMLR